MEVLFEPVVTFPENDLEAAVRYLAVMAYPERGAGQVGQHGSNFANALGDYFLWSVRQSRGLSWLREKRNDPHFVAPHKRQFQGRLERGLRRIKRRSAAYGVLGTQLINGFFEVRRLGSQAIKEGREAEAFHINSAGAFGPAKGELWDAALPSVRRVISADERRWSDRMSLNTTGPAADSAQKAKDLLERAYLPSVPVLHMVHALDQFIQKAPNEIAGWEEREPFSALLMNSDKWIWESIDLAEKWRKMPIWPALSFGPDDMINLVADRAKGHGR